MEVIGNGVFSLFSVQVYLNLNRSLDELYNEKYDNVAVMFASLTDYKLGVEGDADMSDKFLLSILDEIISDFDRVCIMSYNFYEPVLVFPTSISNLNVNFLSVVACGNVGL